MNNDISMEIITRNIHHASASKKKWKYLQRLVFFARRHLGKPYKYGAPSWKAPKVFDCSSFAQYLYKRIGVDLPRTALDQAHLGTSVDIRKDELQTGDLIFTRGKYGHYDPEFPGGIGHVSVYIGDGKVIHAVWKPTNARPAGGAVKKESLDSVVRKRGLVVVKRIIG